MSRHTTRVRAGDDRASLYTEITDKIIAELEAGRIPWVQPWGTAAIKAPLAMPRNAATQRGYSGINVLILWGAVIEHGFSGQSWLTFRQALGLGGHVRKGERGTTVVYADRFTPEDERRRAAEAGEEPGAIPFLKRFTVFNTDQCDGLPEEVAASVVPPPPGQIEPRAEALIAATRADFRIGGARAYYNTTGDFVQVPPPAAYFEPINWHRTAFHELSHNAVTGIMPHGLRWRPVCRALAMRWFGIIRALRGKGEELVVGLEAARWRCRSGDASEGLFLDPHVGVDVDLGGRDRLVSEPEGDYRLVDAMMEQVHRGAVAKRMWRDPLRSDARASARCREAVLADQMFERIAAQPFPPHRREQRPVVVRTVADPCRKQLGRVATERRAALLPALAHAADMRAAAKHHIAAPQVHQLGCSQACLDREQEQCMITPSCPCHAIRSRQQRRDLFGAEERHRALHIALVGHRQDALAVK
jgi:antirestriction protein ArdC